MKTINLIAFLFFIMNTGINAQFQLKETTLDTTTIITGIDIPWEIQWGSDNYIWTTERFGQVSRIHPETGEQDVILDISDLVFQSGESGLLGMVLHPDFENEPYVFMAYTYKPGGSILEKIVRYKYDGESLNDEFILLDNIQGNTTHDGCRLIILPDNTLLFSTGDAQNQPAAQNLDHLSGKVHRLNLDGSIPADNPFPGNPVYSFGHRNAQGLHLASNGIIYSSEHGPSTDDELNILEAGRNYGWPNVHGYCDLPAEKEFCDENNVKEPITAWTPTTAVSDIIYYDHEAIPEWTGKILLTTLKNKRLYVMELDEDGKNVIGEEQLFNNWWERLRDVCMDPEGAIYLATNGPNWSNTEPFTHSIVKVWNPEYVSIPDQGINREASFEIFPNPANDLLKVSSENIQAGLHAKIYTIDGKLVMVQVIDKEITSLDIHSLQAGLYFITINQNSGVIFTEKLFIVRE